MKLNKQQQYSVFLWLGVAIIALVFLTSCEKGIAKKNFITSSDLGKSEYTLSLSKAMSKNKDSLDLQKFYLFMKIRKDADSIYKKEIVKLSNKLYNEN